MLKPVTAMMVLVLAVPLLIAVCGGRGPQEHSFVIQIQNGKPVEGVKTFGVKQGDTVTFNISSDAEGEVHLHGYDLMVDMTPGKTVTLSLTANATGRFPMEIEDTEVEIGFLEVQPR